MSANHGDPNSLEDVRMRHSWLLRLCLVAGSIALVILTAHTFRLPGVPSLGEMEEMTSAAPRLTERCDTIGGGEVRSKTCFWDLWLDDGSRLGWPWPDPKGSPAQAATYLREHGPVTVHFWRGTVYQVELDGGQVYLDGAGVAGWEWFWQWMRVLVGVFVAAVSLIRIELELRRLDDPVTDPRSEDWANALDLVCLSGALVVGAVGPDERWTGVVGLALFAVCAPALGRALRRRRGAAGDSASTSSA